MPQENYPEGCGVTISGASVISKANSRTLLFENNPNSDLVSLKITAVTSAIVSDYPQIKFQRGMIHVPKN